MSTDGAEPPLPLGIPPTAAEPTGRPIAAVLVDTPLAHLNRPFEYTIPADMDAIARPGVRVKVRFAGRDRDGYIVERRTEAEYPGRLAPLRRVVSDERVLTEEIGVLARRLAEHYAGTTADVLRLAIPPRHARAEKRSSDPASTPSSEKREKPEKPEEPEDSVWSDYPAGRAFLRHLAAGRFPAAAWTARPDGGAEQGWPAAIAQATAATLSSGRGVVIVVPDHRDVGRVAAALDLVIGSDHYVRLTADLGPEKRYAAWLRVLRGEVKVALGVRGAAYAPVRDLGLVVWWDDADDLHDEPRAPYPHTREVLRLRAETARAGLLVGGYLRSVAVQGWVSAGWMQPLTPSPEAIRAAAPRVVIAGEGHQERDDPAARAARIPTLAWRAIREGLTTGPVLVQVPRRGYRAGLSCQRCRRRVRCTECGGPMAMAHQNAAAHCQWCNAMDPGSACPDCGSTERRSTTIGHRRTAEELGQAFPGFAVHTSGGEHVLDEVAATPRLVLATPGAEPIAPGGYSAVVLLDGWALLDRAGLDSAQEALRRWMAAAALAGRARSRGATTVVLVGVPAHAGIPAVEALVRWDPLWFAEREWQDRVGLDLPPAASIATLRGDADEVADAVALATSIVRDTAHGSISVADPVPVDSGARHDREVQSFALLRAPRTEHRSLVDLARRIGEGRSKDKRGGRLQIRIDPSDLRW